MTEGISPGASGCADPARVGVARADRSFADRLRLARKLPRAERCAALVAAASAASREEIPAIALELLEIAAAEPPPPSPLHQALEAARLVVPAAVIARLRLQAVRTVLIRWGDLSPELRALVGSIPAELRKEALRDLSASPDVRERAAPLRIAEQTGDPDLIPFCTPLLAAADRTLARTADSVLQRLVLRSCRLGPAELGEELAASVRAQGDGASTVLSPRALDALASAAETFDDHRMRAPLLAAALLPWLEIVRPCPGADRLRALVKSPGHSSHPGLRALLRRIEAPVLREVAWRWLASPALAETAAERLGVARAEADHAPLLRRAYLLLNPSRAHAAATVPVKRRRIGEAHVLPPEAPVPPADVLVRLDASARTGLPRLLAALRTDEPTRRALLDPLLADPDAVVRLAAARQVDPLHLPDFCFDADARVAGSALLRWSGVGAGPVRFPLRPTERQRARLATKLRRSPHPVVRRLAAEESARLDPLAAAGPSARAALRVWLLSDRAGLLDELRTRLAQGNEPVRLRAVQAARELRLEEPLLAELLSLVAAPTGSDRVRASAVAALGAVSAPEAGEAAVAALDHHDGRVRANAVESVSAQARRAPEAGRLLVGLTGDAHHRVRANAVRGLLRLGPEQTRTKGLPSRDGLLAAAASMLEDDRRPHRLAGLWLVERAVMGLGLRPMSDPALRFAALVEDVARGSDEALAVRAEGVAERLRRRLLPAAAASERRAEASEVVLV